MTKKTSLKVTIAGMLRVGEQRLLVRGPGNPRDLIAVNSHQQAFVLAAVDVEHDQLVLEPPPADRPPFP